MNYLEFNPYRTMGKRIQCVGIGLWKTQAGDIGPKAHYAKLRGNGLLNQHAFVEIAQMVTVSMENPERNFC